MASEFKSKSASYALQALSNLELQVLVFENLKQGVVPLKGRHEMPWLLSVALTSKLLCGGALAAHWSGAAGDMLFNLWVVSGALKSQNGQLAFERSPTIAEWGRLRFYARHIKSLTVTAAISKQPVPYKSDFFEQFHQSLADQEAQQPVFPMLKDLTWVSHDDADPATGLATFIKNAPLLKKVLVFSAPSSSNPTDGSSPLMLRIAQSQAVLSSLKFLGDAYVPNAPTNPPGGDVPLAQWLFTSQIKDLTLPEQLLKSRPIVQAIARMAALHSLELTGPIQETSVHPSLRIEVPANAFASLTSLNSTWNTVRSLITNGTFNNLKTISTKSAAHRNTWNASFQNIRDLLVLIGRSCPGLESLHVAAPIGLDDDEGISVPDTPPSRGSMVLNPILRCKHLRQLHIDLYTEPFRIIVESDRDSFPLDFDLKDGDWQKVALAWPSLTSIWYSVGPRCDRDHKFFTHPSLPKPRASLFSLAHLLQNCPQLSHIGIPFSARKKEAMEVSKSLIDANTVQSTLPRLFDFLRCSITANCALHMAGILAYFNAVVCLCPSTRELTGEELVESMFEYPPPEEQELRRCATWRQVVKFVGYEEPEDVDLDIVVKWFETSHRFKLWVAMDGYHIID